MNDMTKQYNQNLRHGRKHHRTKSLDLHKGDMRIKKLGVFLILVAYVAGLLFFTSRNSPLYYQNDWVDLNAFLTMGKGWVHGKIPYRDLFEQKGPILYLLFALASKISKSYLGVYILEIISLSISLLLVYKTARFRLNRNLSLMLCFVTSIFLTYSPFFKTGGSAEELMFPCIMYSIYLVFLLQEKSFQLRLFDYFMAGAVMAVLFWVKYTMIGSFIGLAVSATLVYIILMKYRELGRLYGMGLLGFGTVSIPVLLYFYSQHALDDLFFAYFYSNIKLYPRSQASGVFGKVIDAIINFPSGLDAHPLIYFMLIIGILLVIGNKKLFRNIYAQFIYLSTYFVLIISTFFGGIHFSYYYLILFPFAFIPLFALFNQYQEAINHTKAAVIFTALFSFVMISGMSNNLKYSKIYPNNPSLSLSVKDHGPAQKKFAAIIRKTKNPTLLNYGFLDMGFYQAADILPINRFFEKQNIPDNKLPEMMNEQNRLVSQRKINFVVLAIDSKSDIRTSVPKVITQNYRLVSKHQQFGERTITYLLYKVKE